MPDDDGWGMLLAGDLAGATAAAARLLEQADQADTWEPADLRFLAHNLLGHVALARGDDDDAELRASADAGPSAVLGSFGPDLALCWELLRRGRSDGPIYFAQRFSEFWPGPGHRNVGEPPQTD